MRSLTTAALACGILVLCGSIFFSRPAEAARRRLPWARLVELHGEAAVELGHDDESRDTSDQPKIEQSELLVQEELSVGGSGWLYHPALLNLDADFGVQFNQDFASNKRGRDTDTYVNQFDYNLHLGILPYKPYPMTLFASQLHTEIDSPFAPRREVDTFRYGAGLALRELAVLDLELPSRATYRHQETETDSFAGAGKTIRERDEVEFVMDNETERTRNRLRYNWRSLSTDSRGEDTSSSRNDLRLSQEMDLERGRLSSQAFLVESSGAFDTVSLSINENLKLFHRHSLGSTYGYGFTYQETGSNEQLVHSGRAGVSHQLYESLSSSATINSTYSDADIGTTWTGGAGGHLGYRKKIPKGTFGLRFSPSYLYTKEDIEAGMSEVVNERHDIDLATTILLDRSLIVRSTIRVFDPNTGDEFDRGVDFDVIDRGDRTGIQVIPGSDLDPAVPPLTSIATVNYDYRLEPQLTFSTLSLLSGFSLDLWDHFRGDVSYAKNDQTRIEGDSRQTRLDDSRRLLGTVAVTFPHSRSRFEYERFRSSINPRERYSVSQNFSHRPGPRTSLGVGASYDHDKIMDPDRVTEAVSASGTMTTVLPYQVITRLSLLFRWVNQVEQRSLGASPSLSLTYRYGRLRFQLKDRLTWRKTTSKSSSGRETRELVNTVFFRIERPF
ncbi:MAG: hypothetical protein GY944_11515 [bacterium]|nr:hypothetical protein [bacterium]